MDANRDEARPPGLSDSELEVLKVLWERGSGTVREVNAELSRVGRRWAYTTVQTLLARLQQKGFVTSAKEDVAHTYRPSVSRDELLQQRLSQLETELCGGTATPLVHALVSGKHFTAEEIAHFRHLLDELESSGEASKKPAVRRPRKLGR